MANIKPFRGVRYNMGRFSDAANLISQPYDRVRYGLQDVYYGLSDFNVVRIIKNKEQDGDGPTNNVYTRASDNFQRWLRDDVLRRDEAPALYVYHQTFQTPDGETRVRKAFIAAIELSGFDEGIVLPHERTHAGPKVDRLNLLRATQVNFGLIFMVYPDPQNRINAILDEAIADVDPDVDVQEYFEKDVQQRLWVVTDPDVVAAVQSEMAPKHNLIIADGHHRYETALNYRNEQREAHPEVPANAAFNFCMVALVSTDDPGLTILPTHREIHGYDKYTPEEILERAAAHFDVREFSDWETCYSALLGRDDQHAFGFYSGGSFYLLVLKDPGELDSLIPEDRAASWKSLDVTILHRVLLEQVAGITDEMMDLEEMIRYHRDASLPIQSVAAGELSFAFFLNPTRMQQVKECTEQGEKMPQKSTDFYPKAISGLVMCPVSPEDTL